MCSQKYCRGCKHSSHVLYLLNCAIIPLRWKCSLVLETNEMQYVVQTMPGRREHVNQRGMKVKEKKQLYEVRSDIGMHKTSVEMGLLGQLWE